ncbi:NmrA family NAD(P)-binding protein [Streptomyces reniochalinae]|uniref:NmrA-like domain-containing protein n=1 Tax=Streptomyces reniochalinae TaxID=2250578 RepID=A0A367EEY9_9ACTN|nr:NmrA family NAD(P)-binding protein [Streptomyces reniochalinae]RCG16638.1 hypothetical protein DQ392_21250 [Streptomyces reniochalinae]
MRIAVLGAAGNAGSRVAAEALARGHKVSAVVRDPARSPTLHPGAAHRAPPAGRRHVAGLRGGPLRHLRGGLRPRPAGPGGRLPAEKGRRRGPSGRSTTGPVPR